MNRRQFVAVTGTAVAGLGGCLGGDGDDENGNESADGNASANGNQNSNASANGDETGNGDQNGTENGTENGNQNGGENGDADLPSGGTDSPRALLQAWYEFQENAAGRSRQETQNAAADVVYSTSPLVEAFVLPSGSGDADPEAPEADIGVDSVETTDENLDEDGLDDRFGAWFEPVDDGGVDLVPDARPMSTETKAAVAEENAVLRATLSVVREGETLQTTRAYLLATENGAWQLVALRPVR